MLMKIQPMGHGEQSRARLEVFVSAHCWQCPAALEIARDMKKEFDPLSVRVIDLDEPEAQKPGTVFAVPTFLLNGKIVSLGTPSRDTLRLQIQNALDAEGGLNEPR